MSFQQIFLTAGSAMTAQTVRLNTISSNLANADSVSGNKEDVFKPLKPIFATLYNNINNGSADTIQSAQVVVADVVATESLTQKRHEPGNPLANAEGYVFYSGIDVVGEMADMMSASRSFEMNVEVLSNAKSMQQSLISVLEV
ncbi:MAG: flagellar basal-body rod protein FlgC [Psychromonas sp.]|jgi:flagellar basal-body rod protein FlgC|uniref:flagellar basal body rod protein FlgC n=1 Tax=Psychromonas sp. TaxID=1884585 RepID=UPI0039E6A959